VDNTIANQARNKPKIGKNNNNGIDI
jgi:hypothetical protein